MSDYVRKFCRGCDAKNPEIDYRSWSDEVGACHYDGKCHQCGETLFTGFVRNDVKICHS